MTTTTETRWSFIIYILTHTHTHTHLPDFPDERLRASIAYKKTVGPRSSITLVLYAKPDVPAQRIDIDHGHRGFQFPQPQRRTTTMVFNKKLVLLMVCMSAAMVSCQVPAIGGCPEFDSHPDFDMNRVSIPVPVFNSRRFFRY